MLVLHSDLSFNRAEHAAALSPNHKSTSLILLADDDEHIRLLLSHVLSDRGYQLIAVPNGQSCLKAYERYCPDLIILDGQMPVMDGFTCCHRLRGFSNRAYTPVLMLTSQSDIESRRRAFAVGATDFMAKPFKVDALVDRVRYLLNQVVEE